MDMDELMDQLIEEEQAIFEIRQILTEKQASVKDIRMKMLQNLNTEGVKAKTARGCQIRKVTRTSFKTTIEQARELHAIQVVEKIDRKRLGLLHKLGTPIPGVVITESLSIVGKQGLKDEYDRDLEMEEDE